jgi:hypothetical protein
MSATRLHMATGRHLAEAGSTAKMIMSILDHTTLAKAEPVLASGRPRLNA